MFFVLVFVCLYVCDEHPILVIVMTMMMCFVILEQMFDQHRNSAFFVIIGRVHYIIATSSLYYSYREKHQWKFVLKKLVW